jgi:pyrimidine deaminase RibD-like protein
VLQAIVQLETTRLGELSHAAGATHCEVSAAQSAATRTQTFVLLMGMQPYPFGQSAPVEHSEVQ